MKLRSILLVLGATLMALAAASVFERTSAQGGGESRVAAPVARSTPR
jgi:hypothetical protein